MIQDNPNNWKSQFEVIRVGQKCQIWLPPVDDPEGCLIVDKLHVDYIPSLIAALKNFEQREGR